MKIGLVLSVVAISTTWNVMVYARCTNKPVLQPASKFPLSLQGRMIYHSYKIYGDKTSSLFLKDFRGNKPLVKLNRPSWSVMDPMNAHFSPDGRYITFMAKQNLRWNIFMWQLGSTDVPVNMTQHPKSMDGNSEDPKFSADGNYLVYKRNADVILGHLNFSKLNKPAIDKTWPITNNGYVTEESMPYLSADGKTVYYSQGVAGHSDVYQVNIKFVANKLQVGKPTLVSGRSKVGEFYPVVKNKTLFYVGWKSVATKNDQIYLYQPNLWKSKAPELSLNDCSRDNSDPMPVDASNIIFSSTRIGAFYKLYLGNINTGKVWALSKFGVDEAGKHQLGATYTSVR